MSEANRSRRVVVAIVKFSISAGVLGYLLFRLQQAERFTEFWSRDKDWARVGLAFVLCGLGVVATFLRWFVLVRCLQIPFVLRDAFRLGFIGYLFNFVSLGSVGGDLFKALALVREHPRRRPEALSTVALDRMVGLFSLLLLASAAVLATDLTHAGPEVGWAATVIVTVTVACVVGLLAICLPGIRSLPLGEFLSGLPYVGGTMRRLMDALVAYRHNVGSLVAACLLSLLNQCMYVFAFQALSHGLFPEAPSLASHFLIVPLAMVASALPLPMGALGAFEAAVALLYANVPLVNALPDLDGVLVALGYRAITVAIAMTGVVIWLMGRAEFRLPARQVESVE